MPIRPRIKFSDKNGVPLAEAYADFDVNARIETQRPV
jgi:hypothetical protein